ncbi:hypothetical protein F5B17DRAFT_159640 [Nemania serpens]|nr:hypothetical protein F5B17DRAFT_159640 [Nemania serpens]
MAVTATAGSLLTSASRARPPSQLDAGHITRGGFTELREDMSDDKSSRSTPVFLSHYIDDKVVPIKNGRDLRDALQLQRLQIEWREYGNGGHWVNEPQRVDDIACFISSHTHMPDNQVLGVI